MLKKIYLVLCDIRDELRAIRSSQESKKYNQNKFLGVNPNQETPGRI